MKKKMTVKMQLPKSDTNTILTIIILLINLSCQAQTVDESKPCNCNAVDKSIEKMIPKGVCIPDNYTADEIITDFDFNHDSKNDIAVRYAKYPLEVGDLIYYSIFEQVNDTTYLQKIELSNIYPRYIGNIYAASLDTGSVAHSLLKKYPYDAKVIFADDTIKLSHLIPDDYGKTYKFVYDKDQDNWYLEKIQYWIGNLDRRYIERMDLSEKLLDKVSLESKTPEKKISIKEFDLIKSKKIAEEESEYFMNNYDVFEWEEDN